MHSKQSPSSSEALLLMCRHGAKDLGGLDAFGYICLGLRVSQNQNSRGESYRVWGLESELLERGGVIWGSMVGLIKGDTRNSDSGSYQGKLDSAEGLHAGVRRITPWMLICSTFRKVPRLWPLVLRVPLTLKPEQFQDPVGCISNMEYHFI